MSDANTERPSGACTMPSSRELVRRRRRSRRCRRTAPGPSSGRSDRSRPGRWWSCPIRSSRAARAHRRPGPTATRRRSRGTARSPASTSRSSSERGDRRLGHRGSAAIRRCPRGRPCAPRRRRTPRAVAARRDRACRSRARTTRCTRSRTSSTSCSTSRIATPLSLAAPHEQRLLELRGLARGRAPTTARRAAAASGRVISARPISTSRPRPRLSDSRPCGRRRPRARAGRASPARARAPRCVGAAEVDMSFHSAPVAAADAVGDRGSAHAASCRRRARCAGTSARSRAGPAGAWARG